MSDKLNEFLQNANKIVKGNKAQPKEELQSIKPIQQDKPKEVKRIPFTTSLTPSNRAYLENASFKTGKKKADILNDLIGTHFDDTPKTNFYKEYLKRITK